MKMNKLAAGALALALSLGAVAPAVASEEGLKPTGAQHFLTDYNAELKNVNKLYADYLEAKENEEAKKEVLKAKEAALKAAIAAFDKVNGTKELITEIEELVENNEDGEVERKAIEKVYEVVRKEATTYERLAHEAFNKIVREADVKPAKSYEYYVTEDSRTRLQLKEDAIAAGWTKADDKTTAFELEKALETFVNNRESLKRAEVDKELLNDLAKKLDVAVLERNIAQKEYDDAVAATADAKDEYETARGRLVKLAGAYNVVVQIANDGIQIVDKDDAHVKPIGENKKSKEELVKELKAAADENRAAIKSAEFLLENAPKSVAKVKSKLEDQIVTAKAALAKAEAALAKLEGKVALIATAYADDDVSVDELESLIKENEDAANAINETIKENEKEQPEVEEEETEDDKAPEKEEKEEKEKEEEKKPAKKAGNNARTGIAGVAGVAGILAAASVAYAASKRD